MVLLDQESFFNTALKIQSKIVQGLKTGVDVQNLFYFEIEVHVHIIEDQVFFNKIIDYLYLFLIIKAIFILNFIIIN